MRWRYSRYNLKLVLGCRFGLSGTAMQNEHKELWALLSWAVPQCAGEWRDFDKKYVQPLQHAQKSNATDGELTLVRTDTSIIRVLQDCSSTLSLEVLERIAAGRRSLYRSSCSVNARDSSIASCNATSFCCIVMSLILLSWRHKQGFG